MTGMTGIAKPMYRPLMGEVKNTLCMKGAYTSVDMMMMVRKKDALQKHEAGYMLGGWGACLH